MSRRVHSLSEIRAELANLDPAAMTVAGPWTVAQVLSHCAQSIEYALIGFPIEKPAWFQATLGRLVLAKFIRQGYMSHDIAAGIPGAPPPADLEPRAARDRLLRAIDELAVHAGPLAPHFAYGRVDKDRHARVQAMHIAQHLDSFQRN